MPPSDKFVAISRGLTLGRVRAWQRMSGVFVAGERWRQQLVDLDDLSLAIYRRGSGSPFYWCHGITSNSMLEASSGLQPWQHLGSGWEVILTDLRGHGRSSGSSEPDDYVWTRLASDLLAVQERLGHARSIVGGTSMGAAVALHAASLRRNGLPLLC